MLARTATNETIRDQAAAWTTLLDSGEMSEEDLQRFHRWLEEPLNARALSECQSLLVMIQDLPKHKAAGLVQLSATRRHWLASLLGQPWKLSGVVAATAAVLIAGAWIGSRPAREYFTQTYSTEIGESRTIVLPDESVAYLNTQSRIRWIGAGKERGVVLEKGEVLFEVAHDATRPFRVTVGDSEIRDLATEFDVYRKDNGSVVVTVLSGQVSVKKLNNSSAQPGWSERMLNPNEQVEYASGRLINDVHVVEAPKSILWREGLLETEGQSFTTIIGEMNRYSIKRIRIEDPRLQAADIRIGGMFGIHDVPAALKRIQILAPIVVTDTGDSFVLTLRTDATVKEQPNALQQNAAGRP